MEWSTGGIAITALLSLGWHSFVCPGTTVPFRFLEFIYLYQSIASSSFLSLNYPSVYYRAFSLNFAWAVGLIPSSTLQNSIDRMRHLTGGHLADATHGSAVGLMNRKLSPYDYPSPPNISIELLSRELAPTFAKLSPESSHTDTVPTLRDTATGGVEVVTAEFSKRSLG